MTPREKSSNLALWSASGFIAFLYASLGLAALAGSPRALAEWTRWGAPDWVTLSLAVLEITAGLLVLSPRAGTYALTLLGAVTTGAVMVHLRHEETVYAALTVLMLGLIVTVGTVRGVRDWTRKRLFSVLDAFAEGELAKERRRQGHSPLPRSGGPRRNTLSAGRS